MTPWFTRVVALTGLFLTALAPLFAQRYPFLLYGHEKGLTSPTVRSLLQDSTGFLWVGTSNGLFRYDGSRFRAYFTADGVPAGTVRAIHETPRGVLVVGTSAGVVEMREGRFQPLQSAMTGAVSQRGALASDERNLYIASGSALTVVPHDRSLPSSQFAPPPQAGVSGVTAVHRDPAGVIWTSCGATICRWDGHALSPARAEGLPRQQWAAIETDSNGTLWVRSSTQLWHRPRGHAAFEQVPGDFVSADRSTSLRLDPLGRIAVPTRLGLFLDEDPHWKRLSESNGLPADQASDALWDREGNLWVGLESYGLTRMLGFGAWQGYTSQDGLSINTITAIDRSKSRLLWIGTAFGLNVVDDSFRRVKLWTRHDGLPADDIRALVADAQGGVWVGIGSGGLLYFDSATSPPRRFGPAEGLDDDRVVNINFLRDGTVWVATSGGLFRASVRSSPVRFERIDVPHRMGDGTVYKVLLARDGVLWAVGRQGLLRREGSRWIQFGAADGLRESSVAFLAEDESGALWVGYGNVFGVTRVVHRRNRISVTHYTSPESLTSSNISFLESDDQGRIWIGTDYGVNVYDRGRILRLGTEDGLIWQDCTFNAFLAEPSGPVWIGTNRGVSRFVPPSHFPSPAPPDVVITGIEFPHERVRLPAMPSIVEVLPDHKFVRVQFSALTFAGENRVRFRYRLAGGGADWIPSPQNEVVLQDVEPGEYQFEVQARLLGGAWGRAAVLPLRLLTPWHSSWWFRLIVALLLAGAAVYLLRRRRLQLRLRELQLREAVAQRTREIEIEKAKVEDQKRDIERLLHDAQAVARLKDEFLANISHEIRTPMHAIIGMTALALATPLNDEQREYLETVDSSARSLLHLLNEILDFSKIESGAVELERIPFSVRAVVDSVARTGQAFARGKQLSLVHNVAACVPTDLAGDPTRLRQILLNLFTNAVKFTDQGEVRLDVSVVAISDSRARLRFEVSDTGIGISSEKLLVIWDPFRQADGSTTRRYGGTGLGLAICRRLVEVMGGTIGVESVVGKGSRFTVETAFDVVAAGSTASISLVNGAAIRSTRQPMNVLLVEDNEVSRRFAKRLLEKQGCRVSIASNGGEAVERIQTERYDAVLMDLQMPVLDGLAATRLIREQDRRLQLHTPVVILTANAGSDARNMALEAGADAYLTKPIDLAALSDALDRIAVPSIDGHSDNQNLRPV